MARTSITPIAHSGEFDRGVNQDDSLSGITRSNDQANMLRLTSSRVLWQPDDEANGKPEDGVMIPDDGAACGDPDELGVGGGAGGEAIARRISQPRGGALKS